MRSNRRLPASSSKYLGGSAFWGRASPAITSWRKSWRTFLAAPADGAKSITGRPRARPVVERRTPSGGQRLGAAAAAQQEGHQREQEARISKHHQSIILAFSE